MRILPVIQYLKDNVALLESRVEKAQSLVALPDSELKNGIPIAFVYSSSDSSSGQMAISGSNQRVDAEFTVVMASRNIDVDMGTDPMEDLRDQIQSALVGWKIPGARSVVSFSNGSVLDTSSRYVWWADTYSLSIIK